MKVLFKEQEIVKTVYSMQATDKKTGEVVTAYATGESGVAALLSVKNYKDHTDAVKHTFTLCTLSELIKTVAE